jgi:hypothetical protein
MYMYFLCTSIDVCLYAYVYVSCVIMVIGRPRVRSRWWVIDVRILIHFSGWFIRVRDNVLHHILMYTRTLTQCHPLRKKSKLRNTVRRTKALVRALDKAVPDKQPFAIEDAATSWLVRYMFQIHK